MFISYLIKILVNLRIVSVNIDAKIPIHIYVSFQIFSIQGDKYTNTRNKIRIRTNLEKGLRTFQNKKKISGLSFKFQSVW